MEIPDDGIGYLTGIVLFSKICIIKWSLRPDRRKDNIIAAIRDLGTYVLTFQAFLDHKPTWFQLKAVFVNGCENDLLIGIININAHYRYREDYEQMAREKEMYSRFAALSGKYICINTIDLETNSYTEYNALETDYEGLGLPRRGNDFFQELRENAHRMICEEDLPLFYSMFSREHILEKIKKGGIFTLDYRIVFDKEPKYVSMRAVLDEEMGRKLLLIGLSDIDDQVRQKKEYAENLYTAKTQATQDALTGVKNKLAYDEMTEELTERIRKGFIGGAEGELCSEDV